MRGSFLDTLGVEHPGMDTGRLCLFWWSGGFPNLPEVGLFRHSWGVRKKSVCNVTYFAYEVLEKHIEILNP